MNKYPHPTSASHLITVGDINLVNLHLYGKYKFYHCTPLGFVTSNKITHREHKIVRKNTSGAYNYYDNNLTAINKNPYSRSHNEEHRKLQQKLIPTIKNSYSKYLNKEHKNVTTKSQITNSKLL